MSGEQYDAPNQQVVRPDGSGPWDEGSGGSGGESSPPPEADPTEAEDATDETAAADGETADDGEASTTRPDLDAMTKDELLALAQSLGISPANAAMSKGEIRASLDAYYEHNG